MSSLFVLQHLKEEVDNVVPLGYSKHSVARLIGGDIPTVERLLGDGFLRSFFRGSGEERVTPKSVNEFIAFSKKRAHNVVQLPIRVHGNEPTPA